MKRIFLVLLVAVLPVAALPVATSQTAPTPAPKPQSSSATKPPSASSAAKPAAAPVPAWTKLPPGVPALAHGPVKVSFALRYEEIKVGPGPIAEPHKVYRVRYTGWLAADGHKFDSSDDHPPQPVFDSTLQPVKGPDGKPKMEPGQPILFLEGRPGMIAGWDMGFEGMHVGGKRRLFIPYQLAYGDQGRANPDPKLPGIPGKADLIFDIELLEVLEPPVQSSQPPHPGMSAPARAPVTPHPGATTQPNTAPAPPATPATPAATAPAQPPTTAQPATPPQSAAPPQPQQK